MDLVTTIVCQRRLDTKASCNIYEYKLGNHKTWRELTWLKKNCICDVITQFICWHCDTIRHLPVQTRFVYFTLSVTPLFSDFGYNRKPLSVDYQSGHLFFTANCKFDFGRSMHQQVLAWGREGQKNLARQRDPDARIHGRDDGNWAEASKI